VILSRMLIQVAALAAVVYGEVSLINCDPGHRRAIRSMVMKQTGTAVAKYRALSDPRLGQVVDLPKSFSLDRDYRFKILFVMKTCKG